MAALLIRKLWIGSIPPPYYCQTGFNPEAVECDPETQEECKTQIECLVCPENAICDDQGQLTCNEGFKFINGYCIEDQEINLKAEEIVSHFITILKKLKGSYICGKAEFDHLTYGKLLSDTQEQFGTEKYNQKVKSMLEQRVEELEFQPPITPDTVFKAKEPILSYYCQG